MVKQMLLVDIDSFADLEKRIAKLEADTATLLVESLVTLATPDEQEEDMAEGLILNVTQTAKALGVRRPTVYRLIESGSLPAKRFATGPDTEPRTIVMAEDLRSFLANLPSAEGKLAL